MARILFIDDDRAFLESYVEELRDAHEVVFVDTLDEAVKIYNGDSASFDLIILDLAIAPGPYVEQWRVGTQMPGKFFRDSARPMNRTVPILIFSNFAGELEVVKNPDDPFEYREAKRDHTPETLAKRVDDILARSRRTAGKGR